MIVIPGTTIVYAITVSNAGPSDAQSVILSDTIPSCILNPEYSSDRIIYNPWPGSLNLGTLAPSVTTIVYIRGLINPLCAGETIVDTAIVRSITPDPNPANNTSTVTLSVANLGGVTLSKSVDKNIATVGDTIHYTISIENNGVLTAENVLFNDNIPLGSEFVNSSMKVNGVPVSYRPDQNSNIGNILPGQIVTVEFDVTVIYIPQPPNKQELDNVASILFEIELDGNTQLEGPIFSNIVTTELVNINLIAVKTVDKKAVKVGDTLTYTVTITNNSDITINNVIFSDSIPSGTILIGNQSIINVNLGNIYPKESKTVIFIVKVVSKCPPKLINKATITGVYFLRTLRSISIESNEVITYVGVKAFKQFSVDAIIKIPPQKPCAEDILDTVSSINITYTYLIKTPIVNSYEGQILTGWKLVVEGIIIEKIIYTADEPTQSVHATEFKIPFSSFIILPKEYNPCKNLKVVGILEDIYSSLYKDKRSISTTITLIIQAML